MFPTTRAAKRGLPPLEQYKAQPPQAVAPRNDLVLPQLTARPRQEFLAPRAEVRMPPVEGVRVWRSPRGARAERLESVRASDVGPSLRAQGQVFRIRAHREKFGWDGDANTDRKLALPDTARQALAAPLPLIFQLREAHPNDPADRLPPLRM